MSASVEIYRSQPDKTTVAVTDDVATTGEINFRRMVGGTVYIPDGSGLTSLTFHVAPDLGGTYLPLQNSPTIASPAGTPVAVTMTVAQAKAYPLPAELFGAVGVKMVGNTSGSVDISLKG